MEGNIQNPMQGVLDAPVLPDGPDQDGRIVFIAGEEVADLGLGLAGAVDAAWILAIQGDSGLPKS